MDSAISRYMEYFRYRLKSPLISGICGRVVRGKSPADFLTLTDDPNRKLVMLMGADGLNSILGLPGYKVLETIGYETGYIRRKVLEGCQFKLVVFPEGTPKLATWDNTIQIVGGVYPDAAKALNANLPFLKVARFTDIQGKDNWNEIDAVGTTHPKFMTYERFLDSKQDVIACRAFLYFTVHLRELYSGDGYTYTPQGNRGLMEYIVPNLPISALGEYRMADIEVKI